jgi:hypothetical protein
LKIAIGGLDVAIRSGLSAQKDGGNQNRGDAEFHGAIKAGTQARANRFAQSPSSLQKGQVMIRKLASGAYRLYSRKKNPKTGKRRNLGTFDSRKAAEKHERAVQYFKHH